MKTTVARRKSPLKVTIDNSLNKANTSAFDKKYQKVVEILKKSPIPEHLEKGE